MLYDRDFIADFLFGEHNSVRQWKPSDSAVVVGELYLETLEQVLKPPILRGSNKAHGGSLCSLERMAPMSL